MSQSTSLLYRIGARSGEWRNYWELCKPNVVMVMLITVVIGMLLARTQLPSLWLVLVANLGIGFCAASAAVVNHVVDRHIDLKMVRTSQRPVATGKVEPARALAFAGLLGLVGMSVLLTWVNAVTAWLTLASLLGYALIYTLFLKRATPQNIVIGGIAGAAPPLLGWTAVTGSIDGPALLLVLIIFAWTPPHFWALAVHRKDDYANAGIPMLPVTHGIGYTKIHILLYTLILLSVSLLPFVTGMLGWLYLLAAVSLGAGFIGYSLLMLKAPGKEHAMATFKYSIIYLLALFVAMLMDHYLIAKPELYTGAL
ncbi:heme o synthase [Halioxenophilus sp. WMMB6]|uniref:heme o synthase n=1 Tax=Halioxenophilus sp. WMMB6 TaxID=3073815 RepID=UPI00295E8A59|nr:heme o synthase [Halioxenophilus sp. WMMB6]